MRFLEGVGQSWSHQCVSSAQERAAFGLDYLEPIKQRPGGEAAPRSVVSAPSSPEWGEGQERAQMVCQFVGADFRVLAQNRVHGVEHVAIAPRNGLSLTA